jgi:transcriptional regulator with XRE-family HTH domain
MNRKAEMTDINLDQIRAARAFLKWSGEDLASALGCSLMTIRRLERDGPKDRPILVRAIKALFEERGIEFTPWGVIMRPNTKTAESEKDINRLPAE